MLHLTKHGCSNSSVLACLKGRIARLEAMLGVPPPCAYVFYPWIAPKYN